MIWISSGEVSARERKSEKVSEGEKRESGKDRVKRKRICISMESVNYKSLEEANNLLNEDDLPSSNSKAPPSPSPSIRSRSRSKSPSGNQLEYDDVGDSKSPSTPLKSRHGENNNHNSAAADPSTAMECGPRNLIIVAGICCEFVAPFLSIIEIKGEPWSMILFVNASLN